MILGNIDGSTATIPILLRSLFPKALAENGLGDKGVALATCCRFVRLSVKLTGTDWFATRIISAPIASCTACWSAPRTSLWIPPIKIAKLRTILIILKQTLLLKSFHLPLRDQTYATAIESKTKRGIRYS